MRLLTASFALALAGCTVQIGRNPENTFTVDTDLKSDPPTGEGQAPSTGSGQAPPESPDPRPGEAPQDAIQRNWRIGAENTAPDRSDPARHYADLYGLFRSDHAEAVRLAGQGDRARAQLFANRAARHLAEMKPLLDPSEQASFEKVIARYKTHAEEIPDVEGSILRLAGQSLSSEIAKRFSPESAHLAPPNR